MIGEFINVNDREFTLNGISFDKVFLALPLGTTNIKVVGIYESRTEILKSTPVSEISVGGTTYATAADLIEVLRPILFNPALPTLPSPNVNNGINRIRGKYISQSLIDAQAGSNFEFKLRQAINASISFNVIADDLWYTNTIYNLGNGQYEARQYWISPSNGEPGTYGKDANPNYFVTPKHIGLSNTSPPKGILGDVGATSILDTINSLDPAVETDETFVFTGTKDGEEFVYAYTGASSALGLGETDAELSDFVIVSDLEETTPTYPSIGNMEDFSIDDIPLGKFDLPVDFPNILKGQVLFDGNKFRLDYANVDQFDFTKDGTPHDKYYVDYTNGSDSNDGSEATPFKSYNKACDEAQSSGNPTHIILLDDWIGYLSMTASSETFTNHVKIEGRGPSRGRTMITQKRESYEGTFSWVDNSDGTFTSTTNQYQYQACFDALFRDDWGGARPMLAADTLVECQNTPGSYFWNSGASSMTVHMFDGREPDSNWLYTGNTSGRLRVFMDNSAGIAIFENLEVYQNVGSAAVGGIDTRCQTYPDNTAKLGCKNVLVYGASGDGFEVNDYETVVMERCYARYNRKDGFNYHSIPGVSTGGYMNIYEIDCKSLYHGWDGWYNQAALTFSNNGSSAHDGMNILRVNCQHGNSLGSCIADVGGTYSINYGVTASRPNLTAALAPNGGVDPEDRIYNSAFWYEGSSGAVGTQTMILVGCKGSDITEGDIEAFLLCCSSPSNEIAVKFWKGAKSGKNYGTIVKY